MRGSLPNLKEPGKGMTGNGRERGRAPLVTAGLLLIVLLVLNACAPGDGSRHPSGSGSAATSRNTNGSQTMPTEAPPITRTDEEWKKLLTPQQYEVARRRGTEPPNGRAYEEFESQGEGTYYCVCCGAELFTSKEKFNSGCGWPSFYDPSTAKNVAERVDRALGMTRTEVICRRCDAHLGHVFDREGFPTPTDRRFCINAASLRFVPKGGAAPPLLPADSSEVDERKADVAREDSGG